MDYGKEAGQKQNRAFKIKLKYPAVKKKINKNLKLQSVQDKDSSSVSAKNVKK